ncbi:hypothetical protein [Microbulbifer sp. VAAF005]|uniref:hypothetical protein n=1 Tax=Microbulbifer sp. VAAF005 TaxID=3034230 RepID=UPI0024AE75EA|nr:hypothetical protein [Microbulbifer sp. VAAF005]WHI48432.1 hypothetical protein P0078_08685 [Microbulbifer sp. VAAF005]
MLKKFLSGVIFGSGFAVAALSLYTAWMFYVIPPLVIQNFDSEMTITEASSIENNKYPNTPNFHELSVDEMIEKATVILTVRYEPGEDGNYKSVVEDILKQEDGVDLYYGVGEVYEENTHDKMSDDFTPKKAVVFMQGNPASMRYSTAYSGERIRGLGGISLDLLKEKCSKT